MLDLFLILLSKKINFEFTIKYFIDDFNNQVARTSRKTEENLRSIREKYKQLNSRNKYSNNKNRQR